MDATGLVERDSVSRIEALERQVLSLPQVDLRTEHAFSPGHYGRTIYIPADTVLTGATHKKDHINLVAGDITVTTDAGPRRFTGFHIIPGRAGFKRAGFAHADTVWMTICKTDLTDLAAIEDELVVESDRLQTRQLLLQANTFEALEK